MKKILAKLVANLALTAAKSAAGTASEWFIYQPKEPTKLLEMLKR